MTAAQYSLLISVFVASLVEAVEAVTIVLAAGVARSWKSSMLGVLAALMSLGAVIAIFGPSIALIPIETLRLVVGLLLLLFGLQWLRKAILRASGHKALHDEEAIYERELKEAKSAKKSHWLMVDDWYGFTMSFKGVLLEGLEVAFIVVTFGALQNQIALASIAGLAAAVVAALLGFAIKGPLTNVPENTMKFAVGIMLVVFGVFWSTEGVGIEWPSSDTAILFLIVWFAAISWLTARVLRGVKPASKAKAKPTAAASVLTKVVSAIWNFVVGEDWKLAATASTLVVVAALTGSWMSLPLLLPLAVFYWLRFAVKRG